MCLDQSLYLQSHGGGWKESASQPCVPPTNQDKWRPAHGLAVQTSSNLPGASQPRTHSKRTPACAQSWKQPVPYYCFCWSTIWIHWSWAWRKFQDFLEAKLVDWLCHVICVECLNGTMRPWVKFFDRGAEFHIRRKPCDLIIFSKKQLIRWIWEILSLFFNVLFRLPVAIVCQASWTVDSPRSPALHVLRYENPTSWLPDVSSRMRQW